jgi:hypothetical protein
MAGPAAATQSRALAPSDIEQLSPFFEKYGVDEAVQERLIVKLESGEIWDSMKPGSSPSSKRTVLDGSSEVTIKTYPDGSIVASHAPVAYNDAAPGGRASTKSVSGCSVSSSPPYAVYYRNCKAKVDFGVIMMGFQFNYENITSQGRRITSYCCREHRIIGGSLSDHRLERRSSTQVRYSADVSLKVGGVETSWVAWMQANVGASGAWTTNN